jgi:hypothetical protein
LLCRPPFDAPTRSGQKAEVAARRQTYARQGLDWHAGHAKISQRVRWKPGASAAPSSDLDARPGKVSTVGRWEHARWTQGLFARCGQGLDAPGRSSLATAGGTSPALRSPRIDGDSGWTATWGAGRKARRSGPSFPIATRPTSAQARQSPLAHVGPRASKGPQGRGDVVGLAHVGRGDGSGRDGGGCRRRLRRRAALAPWPTHAICVRRSIASEQSATLIPRRAR